MSGEVEDLLHLVRPLRAEAALGQPVEIRLAPEDARTLAGLIERAGGIESRAASSRRWWAEISPSLPWLRGFGLGLALGWVAAGGMG